MAERERLWKVAEVAYPRFAEYRTKATRMIPIFVAERGERTIDLRPLAGTLSSDQLPLLAEGPATPFVAWFGMTRSRDAQRECQPCN